MITYPFYFFQFKFNSYSAEDDDYEGYDYSLQGRLSAVRIVFLYRFVQEVCWTLWQTILMWCKECTVIFIMFRHHSFILVEKSRLFLIISFSIIRSLLLGYFRIKEGIHILIPQGQDLVSLIPILFPCLIIQIQFEFDPCTI